jgi:hypothetical protein
VGVILGAFPKPGKTGHGKMNLTKSSLEDIPMPTTQTLHRNTAFPREKTRGGSTTEIYQLHVSLREISPVIWRRIQVPGNTSLHQLHWMIQGAMGWMGSHLYQYKIGGIYYGVPDPDYEDFGMEMRSANTARLSQVVRCQGHHFVYEYDLGDSWRHEIRVENIFSPELGKRYPACLAGGRACPPEDCGGSDGYGEFLDRIAFPQHPRYQEMIDWVGRPFNPEAFDLIEANLGMKNRPPQGEDLF